MSRQRTNLLTIDEFLARNRLDQGQFDWLRKMRLAPAAITVEGKVLISRRAERSWVDSMEKAGTMPPGRKPIQRR